MEGGGRNRAEKKLALLSMLLLLIGPGFGIIALARQGMQPRPQVTIQSSQIKEDILQAHCLDTSLECGAMEKENPVDNLCSPSPNPHPENSLGVTSPVQDSENNNTREAALSPLSPGTITVNGELVYWDEKEGANHYCRHAYCELWDKDADGYDDLLDTSTTDATGHFSLGPVDNSDEEGGGQDIYVWFYTDSSACRVYDRISTYVCGNPIVNNVLDGTYDYGTKQVPSNHRGAWNILDQIVKGYQWVDSRPSTNPPPKATVMWFLDNADGTHFHPDTHEIHILGETSDRDQFDDGTILHEYGHFIAHLTWSTKPYVFDNSPGGSHVWHGVYSPELAWSEGWGHYFSSAVRGVSWIHDAFLDQYYDPQWVNYSLETGVASYSTGITYDANAKGEGCEASVAGVIWDITDSVDDDQDSDGVGDTLSLTTNMVWYIVRTQTIAGHGIYNINEFWTAWFYCYTYANQMWTIYYEHGIEKEDSNPPSNPDVCSCSHMIDVWSNNHTITILWWGETDDLSGIYGYVHVWDMNPTTIPVTTLPIYKRSNDTMFLADSSNWYLHVRVRDNAGNWASGAYHVGPFKIDGTPPSNPTGCSSVPAAYYWTNDSTIQVSWYGASDSLSDIFGYSYIWDTSATTVPDTVADTKGTSKTSPALADGSSWYFHVRASDHAGNWANGAIHYGPFKIDTTPPTNPDSCSSSPGIDVWTMDNTIEVSWSGATDEASGISGYSYVWDHSSSTSPDTTLDTTGTSITSSELADGSDWYFHVRARDKAGNWAVNAYHMGPFKIDRTVPTIDSTNPEDGASNVNLGTTIIIEFSEPMNRTAAKQLATIGPTVEIESFTWSNDNKTLTLVMKGTLQYGTEYTVSILNATDLAGNQMASYSWKFNTVPRPTGLPTATLTLVSAAAVVVILLMALAVHRIRRSSKKTKRSSTRTRRP